MRDKGGRWGRGRELERPGEEGTGKVGERGRDKGRGERRRGDGIGWARRGGIIERRGRGRGEGQREGG
jgi:hypothetical protein